MFDLIPESKPSFPPGTPFRIHPKPAPVTSPAAPRILVIDDDPAMREIFEIVLRRAALDVRTAGTVEEARASASAAVDLILLDLHLSESCDGLDLARELASSPKQTPIVVVSASSDPSIQERTRQAGCAGFISKPIDPRTLAAEVKRFLPKTAVLPSESKVGRDIMTLQLRGRFLDAALQAMEDLTARADDHLFSDRSLATSAHRWIGASGIGGVPDVQDSARELEALALAKDLGAIDRIHTLLRSVRTRFEEAREAVPN